MTRVYRQAFLSLGLLVFLPLVGEFTSPANVPIIDAALATPSVQAACVKCKQGGGCDIGGTNCCCSYNCVGGNPPTCGCTQWCTTGACACFAANCQNCLTWLETLPQVRIATLGDPQRLLPPRQDGFALSDADRKRLAQEMPIGAVILDNLTRDCKSKKPVELGPVTNMPFEGYLNQGSGDFSYEGRITVKDRRATLDLVLQPDLLRRQIKLLHFEVTEQGNVSNVVEELK